MTPLVEKTIVDSGVILLKYWLELSPEEQTRRLEGRIEDGLLRLRTASAKHS
jgi:polyphosphate kinase